MTVRMFCLIILILTFFCGLLSRGMEKNEKKIQSMFFINIALIILIILPGLRSNIGDTYVYKAVYSKLGYIKSWNDIMNDKDRGYTVYTLLLYQITSNPQIMIFVNALLTQTLYFKFFYKYRSMIELQLYIYIASGYFFITMNGMRQCLAAGIILIGTKYLVDKRFVKYTFIIILASFFHQSALIMIPIYFIANMEPWSKNTIIIIVLTSLGTLMFFELLPLLEKILQGTQYENYIQIFEDGIEQGANPIRIIVALIPLILSYIRKDELREWKESEIFINMSMVNLVFMIFSLNTWIFARFTIYFNLYNFVLLPYIIKTWNNRKERQLLYVFLIICYLIFFFREHGLEIIKTNYSIQRFLYW